jgi:NAD(P)-dependent dehydrogenase (short-subunit alcohol dehydrogenase family)
MNLKNQRVVIIGGTAGIGLAVAALAIQEGASVVVASGTKDRVQKAIKQLGPEADGNVLNVLVEDQVDEFFQVVGEVDHLVYTAGDALTIAQSGTLSLKDAKQRFDVRYWGAYLAVKFGHSKIRAQGSIVFDLRSCWPATDERMDPISQYHGSDGILYQSAGDRSRTDSG